MRKHLIVMLVTILFPVVVFGAPVLTPGKWELTLTTQSAAGTVSTVTVFCVQKEQAEKLDAPKSKEDDDCKVVTPAGLSANVLAYKVKCSKKNASSDSTFIYHGDRYEGQVTITTADYEVRQVHSARRLGDCDAAEDEGRAKP
jgi:Protein of unknown function (DUF3617)